LSLLRHRWSLRVYMLGLTALTLLAMGIGAAYVGLQAQSTARQTGEADAAFGANAASTAISKDLQQVQTGVAKTAATPGIAQLLDPRSKCTLAFGGAGVFSTGHLDILRQDGSVACSSTSGAHTAGYAAAPWLPGALRGSLLVAPFLDPASSAPVAVLATPMTGGVGLVAAFVDLPQVAQGIASILGGRTQLEFVITTSDGGTVLTRSINPGAWSGKPIAGTAFATGSAQTERQDLDGTTRLYGVATASTQGWRVYAGEDAAAALESARALANHDIAIIGAAAVLVIIGVLILYRRIALPISRLERAVRASKDDEAFSPIAMSGPSEIAALTSSFNSLMTSVNRELVQRRQTEERLSESLATLEVTDAQRRRLLDKLVSAQEEERRRIASDVHDDSIQVMAAALMRISLIRQQGLDPAVEGQLAKLQDTTERAIERLRHLLFQLRPPSLDREGLAAALIEYLDQWTSEANLTYHLDNKLTVEPPPHIRAKLFRIAQEALTNVRKHARARTVTITLEGKAGGVLLRIQDDGVGIAASEPDISPIGHLGLVTMRERAELAGGWCHIDGRASAGTTVEVWVPASNVPAAVA
jgi:signal transduction histidine kinase